MSSTDDTAEMTDTGVEFDDDEPVISLENVEVHFTEESLLMDTVPDSIKDRLGWEGDTIRAVDDVSLDIGENDVVAVIGESGSGKTTLGKTAVGLENPTGGTIKYRGYDIHEVKEQGRVDDLFFDQIRRSLQIVHQDPGASLNPYRKITTMLKESLNRWYPEMSRADRRERILSLFEKCGMTPATEYEDRYPHELSGGEQQRVALIRSMLLEPDLILADEPVSALDNTLRVELMDLMLELQDLFDTSYMFITHDLAQARYFAGQADGRIAVMYLGEIVEVGPVEEVIQNPKHPYTKILKWADLPIHPDSAREALTEDTPLRQIDIPELSDLPTGCRFHPRCPEAREACVNQPPDQYPDEEGENHHVACYRELDDHEYWDSEPLSDEEETSPQYSD